MKAPETSSKYLFRIAFFFKFGKLLISYLANQFPSFAGNIMHCTQQINFAGINNKIIKCSNECTWVKFGINGMGKVRLDGFDCLFWIQV